MHEAENKPRQYGWSCDHGAPNSVCATFFLIPHPKING